jgi:hypothetical protein
VPRRPRVYNLLITVAAEDDMNEEPTKDIGQKYDTKPTLETILERMIQMEERLHKEFNSRFDGLESRFDAMEIRMDRLEGEVHETKSLFFSMRADIKAIHVSVKEHFKEPA